MRYRRLTKWDDPSSCAELVYFVQLVEEMLFDFSLDTYKSSVMHTGLLCIEALETIKQINMNIIKQPNLKHVTDEFCNFFEKDEVAKQLTSLDFNSLVAILKNPKTSIIILNWNGWEDTTTIIGEG